MAEDTLIRTCIFCERRITKRFVTCREHYDLYLQYKDTDWCKFLKSSELKQTSIDEIERLSIFDISDRNFSIQDSGRYLESVILAQVELHAIDYKEISKKYMIPVYRVYRMLGKDNHNKRQYGGRHKKYVDIVEMQRLKKDGLSSRKIAEIMGVSRKTIDSRMKELLNNNKST